MLCKGLTKCTLFLSILGFILLVAGCVLIPVFHNMITSLIKQNLQIKPGTATYKAWQSTPVPIYFQIWVYDLVNPIEVVQNGDKPAFVQRGPYTYREHRNKENITINDNGTLSYRETRSFNFVRHKSVGPEEDTFTTINLIMVTIVELIRLEYKWIQELVEIILDLAGDSSLFNKLSVKGIMWGYTDPLLHKVRDILKRFNKTIDDQFGLFYGQNGTDDGLYTIFDGTTSTNTFADIQMWNRNKLLPFWTTKSCNMINGTDGTMFPPFVTTDDMLYIFSSDICRSIYTTFKEKIKLKDIDLYRFTVPPKVFLDVKHNKDNLGFCTPSGNCLPSGLLNVATCREGAPVVMSQPNFLAADPKVINSVIGIHPDESVHGTLLDVEPRTGVVMNAQKRLQINILIKNVSRIRETRMIKEMYYPVLWLNESAVIDDKSANDFKSQVLTPIKITEAVQYGLIILGVFILMSAIALIIRGRITNTAEEDLKAVPSSAPTGTTMNYDTSDTARILN